MGLPSYFRIILQRYKDSHNDKNTNKTDYFLIDFNSDAKTNCSLTHP